MLRRTKKVTALALSCMMLAGMANLQVSAASSVTGSCAGTETSGYVTTNSTSATAVTAYARSGATIQATAFVYYWWGEDYYYSTATTSSSAGGTAATATKYYGGADVIGGQGLHKVICGGEQWVFTTEIGIWNITAKPK